MVEAPDLARYANDIARAAQLNPPGVWLERHHDTDGVIVFACRLGPQEYARVMPRFLEFLKLVQANV